MGSQFGLVSQVSLVSQVVASREASVPTDLAEMPLVTSLDLVVPEAAGLETGNSILGMFGSGSGSSMSAVPMHRSCSGYCGPRTLVKWAIWLSSFRQCGSSTIRGCIRMWKRLRACRRLLSKA